MGSTYGHQFKRKFEYISAAPSRGWLAGTCATSPMQEVLSQVGGIPMIFCNTGHRQTKLAAS